MVARVFLSDVICSYFVGFLMALDDAISPLDGQSESTSVYEKETPFLF